MSFQVCEIYAAKEIYVMNSDEADPKKAIYRWACITGY
jgi:hypothetical protein